MRRTDHETRFRDLATRMRPLAIRVARTFAEPADREDLEQEIWLALWFALARFRGDAKATTFAYRVALNTGLLWQRTGRRRPPTAASAANPIDLAALQDSGPSPFDTAAAAEREALLEQAIRHLSPIDRTLLLMHFDELSYAEIAEVLGISAALVGTRLSRIRRRLPTLLGGT